MKIALNTFAGIRPILPDHNLPENAASLAVNVRLDNSAIRNLYQSNVSAFTPETLSVAPNNMFKASYAPNDISWMIWELDSSFDTVDVLETRFNTLSQYVAPVPATIPPQGVFSIEFSSPAYVLGGEYVLFISYVEGETLVDDPHLFSQQITASSSDAVSPPITYVWTYVSGDVSIVVDDPNIEDPTFSTSVDRPAIPVPNFGFVLVYETKTAVWLCTGTDNVAGVGTREVTVSFSYSVSYGAIGPLFPPGL